MFHNGMTNNKEDYELCMRAENVNLPKSGYFGISAATGGLAGWCATVHVCDRLYIKKRKKAILD